jgi:uncharacterized membrane protein
LRNQTKKKLLVIGSFLLGFGFMGAMDGIVFHQLLQWHSVVMETSRSGQIMSDGIFHFAVTIALVAGGFILWLAGNPSEQNQGIKQVIGWFLIGSGLFNVLEGIINHHILQIHRVKPGDPNALFYDIAFLILGAILFLIGLFLKKSASGNKGGEEIHV